MFSSLKLGTLTIAALLVGSAGSCVLGQQTDAPAQSPAPETPSSRTQKPDPAKAPASPTGTSSPTPPQAATPPAQKAADPKTPPADDNPFPEEQSLAAQKQATEQDQADRKAANSGSAASDDLPGEGSGSSSRDKLKGMDVLGERESRTSNGAGGTVVDPKLSTEDVRVGQQYMGMGNFQGAYARFKEACTVNPGNVEAVFYLAEAARKTAHLDESAENYKIYLDADPSGSKAKAARKALAELQGR